LDNKLIRLSRSHVGLIEQKNVLKVLEDGYLGIGKFVEDFEREIQEFLQTKKNVICVNSGTAALHLSLQAVGLLPGDEVLVPSITYLATYQAIKATGAIPISCDVLSNNLFINLDDARKRLSKKTKVILPVHYGGNSDMMPEVYKFAEKYGLRIIEDAAHSFGSYRKDGMIGVVGDIICFSFDGIKNITCGEGGAILSSDKDVINRVKDARLLGVCNDSEKRYKGQRSWDFDVINQGWRYHMSNINAALGLAQIKECESRFKRKKEIASKYIKYLKNNPNIKLLEIFSNGTVNHIFPIIVNSKIRDDLRKILIENNIETGLHYHPNHLLEYFKSDYSLPISEAISKRIISLPFHSLLKDQEQEFVIYKLLDSIDKLVK